MLATEEISQAAQNNYIAFLKQRQNICFRCEKLNDELIQFEDYYICQGCNQD